MQAFLVALFLSVVLGVGITYAIALCATINSPLATSVTGNIKDIVCTALGWAIFGGFVATPVSIGGLLLSFTGAALYSTEKLMGAMRAAPHAAVKLVPAASMTPKAVAGERRASDCA
jgi:hypothetical protein